MIRSAAVLLALLSAATASAQPRAPETPVPADNRLGVTLFAAAPDIVHPIALDFDATGRLLVVESHTHFRPANYTGPKADRVRVLEDTDGDGRADKFTTFYEGLTHTMDLAVHPDGSVYVATRNEIVRLRDTKGTGTADERVRIAFLETKGNYPHNGLCGLSFDSRGDLNFGIGENLGETFKLVGADGTTLTGGGEGGSVFHVTADGKKLRRVATGFWNPFGSCRDIYGRLFVVDNDPDASPPCRLLHVVDGGDYGFQFRYGRAGRHPFQAWNGEVRGTLPMVAGTGESPCEVISYESDGLPDEYRGELLVPAWADHRLERYTLKPNGASFTAERKPFVQGGKDFYPSGLTVAPNGSLFVSDWGSRSYELHGKGAVWQVRWKDQKPEPRPKGAREAILSKDRRTREAAARQLAATEAGREALRAQLKAGDVRVRAAALAALLDSDPEYKPPLSLRSDESGLREMVVRAPGSHVPGAWGPFGPPRDPPIVLAEVIRGAGTHTGAAAQLRAALESADPFLRHAAVSRLAHPATPARERIEYDGAADANVRIGLLLAWRASGHADGARHLALFLKDSDPDVRFLAVKWVSDEKLSEFRPRIEEMLKTTPLAPREYVGLATALARVDGKPVSEQNLADYFLVTLNDATAPLASRLLALRAIPAAHAKLKSETLLELLKHEDAALRVEALRAIKDRGDVKAAPAALEVAKDAKQPAHVRAQAVLALSALSADVNTFVALAGEGPTRDDALRALVGAKLTDEQGKRLLDAAKGSTAGTELYSRLVGKAVGVKRPDPKDTAAWLKYLEGPADPDAGRRVFESPRLAGCYKCHQVEGRGANIGPDLSLIGRTERKWVLESILQPSAVVAPHYQAWKIELTDSRELTGLLVHTQLDVSEYIDEKGRRFKVTAGEVASTRAAKQSVMPDGLLDGLTDQEVRDLVAYLSARK